MLDISDKMMKLGELSVDDYLSGKSVFLVDFQLPDHMNEFFLQKVCTIEDLAKLYRNCIWSENYEGMQELKTEIERRGYTITISDNTLSLK